MSRHMLIAALAAIALLAARPGLAADAKQMEENKKAVAAFYDAVLNQKDFDAAAKYLGSRYTQHNPGAADGPEGLKGFIAFLKDKFPNNRSEIKRIFADGDYVIVHVHAVREPGTRGNASSTSSNSRMARSSSIGTWCSRSRKSPPTPTECSSFQAPPLTIDPERTSCSSTSIPAGGCHDVWSSWVLKALSDGRARGCWRPRACRCCRWGAPRPIFSPPGPQTGFPRNFVRTMPSW